MTRTVRRVNARWLNQQIGRRLRQQRLKKRLTQNDVALAIGVSRACVANWETGASQANFLIAQLYNLSLFYAVPVSRLLP